MTRDRPAAFDAAVDRGWAERAGCPPADLHIPQTIVRPKDIYAGMNGAFFWFLRDATVLELDPA
ncbi:MAG: hypothetical protein HKN12_07955, partial [Gemmatimonadetes bacterium]|nr:hypothetical protein [Gemmatimonadota bacterium]